MEIKRIKINPRFVINDKGKRVQVLLTIAEYKSVLDEIERLKKSIRKWELRIALKLRNEEDVCTQK
jgi:hypothetical protein